MDETIAQILKAVGGGPKLGFLAAAVGAAMLVLDHQKIVDLATVGAWATPVAWLVLVVGVILMLAALAEWGWNSVRQSVSPSEGQLLDAEAERNLSVLVDEERVYLNWLFHANMQRFPCDYWDDGIEGLKNKQIIYTPEHSTGGVYVIRDSVWKHREELVADWSYMPSAFKPLGLLTASERAERKRI